MDNLESFGINVDKGKYKEESIYGVGLVYSFLHRAVSEYLKPFNLTPAKFNVLLVIKHQGGKDGISQIDIGKRLIVTASNMTRLLDKLVKEGYVTRGAKTGDRRVNMVEITKKGSDILDKSWPGYIETIESLAQRLEAHDQKALSELLMKWFKNLTK
jgi:DNA-binding MarR family transcriptional regulator